MSSVYAVVVTSNINDCLYVDAVEAYAGSQAALGSALRWATRKTNNITFVDTSPEEEKMEDGSIRWVFLDTSKHFVGVIFTRIETSLPAQNTRLDAVRTMPVVPQSSVVMLDGYQSSVRPSLAELIKQKLQQNLNVVETVDAWKEENLPGGWDVDGEPVRMKHYKDSAEDIKDPIAELTENEKWALVIARVSKRPKFFVTVSGYTYHQSFILDELKARTLAGVEIRNRELQQLSQYRDKMIQSDHGIFT